MSQTAPLPTKHSRAAWHTSHFKETAGFLSGFHGCGKEVMVRLSRNMFCVDGLTLCDQTLRAMEPEQAASARPLTRRRRRTRAQTRGWRRWTARCRS